MANNQKNIYKTFDKTIKKYKTLKDRLKSVEDGYTENYEIPEGDYRD